MITVAAAAAPDLGSLQLNGAVSAAIGLVALAAAATMWFTGPHAPRLVVLLLMTGIAGMLGTPIGSWLRSVVDWLNQATANITTRWTGTAVTGLLAGIATFVLIVRMKDKRVDKWTLLVAAFVPIAAATIPGPLGRAAYTAVTAVTAVMGWAISQAFGIA
jgi:hypothetical protein